MKQHPDTLLPALSDQARLWVIPLQGTPEAMLNLYTQTQRFLEGWTSHGRAIQSSVTLNSNRFLLIGGEIAGCTISGCGIDTLMNALEELSEHHQCCILPSMSVYYRSEDGTVEYSSRSQFQEMITQGLVSAETSVFNLGIYTLDALRAGKFELPLSDSIYARIFQVPVPAT